MRNTSHNSHSFPQILLLVVFFNDTATTEIYTLSLHDALPIYRGVAPQSIYAALFDGAGELLMRKRSEEHTSELQSPYVLSYAVFCLQKKHANVAQQSTQIECPKIVHEAIQTHY